MKLNKSRNKVYIEIIVIIIVIGLIICSLNIFYKYKDCGGGGGFENFYAATDDSIDVMFFGSSHAHCTVDTSMLWQDAGIAGFILSAGAQSIDSTYYYMREALKSQTPKVVFVETYKAPHLCKNDNGNIEYDLTNIYRTDLPMNFSLSYFSMVLEQAGLYGFTFETTAEYLFKLPIVHSRYNEITIEDQYNQYFFRRGYKGSFECVPATETVATERRNELSDESKEYLRRIVELCNSKGVDVVFFCAPYSEDETSYADQNGVSDYINSLGEVFIDFNRLYDEISFNFATDIRDGGHVNNSGSAKVTKYLEQYILSNYEISDHRGDEDYYLWDLDSKYVADRTDLYELECSEDVNQYLSYLSSVMSKYVIIISLDGQYNVLGESAYSSSLAQLGINTDSYEQGGTYIINKGEIAYWSGYEDTFKYIQKFDQGTIEVSRTIANSLVEDDYNSVNSNDKLIVNGINYSQVVNGINIVVYDPDLNLVMDSVGVNVYLGLTPDRNIEIEF